MNWVYHNSFVEAYRKPFGAVIPEETIRFQMDWYPDEPQPAGELSEVCLVLSDDVGEEHTYHMNLVEDAATRQENVDSKHRLSYEVSCKMPGKSQLMWYYFKLHKGEGLYVYGKRDALMSGEGIVSTGTSALFPYQITIYDQPRNIPSWFKEGIVYQIFVDRFYRTSNDKHIAECEFKGKRANKLLHLDWHDEPIYIRDTRTNAVTHWDFFGGDLEGVIRKLPYLRTLGVNCLYLNPIFESPSNHKYDTGDYLKIDPMFGTEEIFKKLVFEARKQGMRIILDGVFSHTGDDSRYFNRYGHYNTLGAYQSKDSPYYPWYRFRQYPDDYESWWDIWNLPNVNEMEPSYLDFIIRNEHSVLAHWMKTGISGWRLDVADELPDEFIRLFKKNMIERNPQSVLIGEVWEDASNKMSYHQRRRYLLGEELDSTMHYPFKDIALGFLLEKISAIQVVGNITTLQEHYPPEHFQATLNILGTHDTRRLNTELGEDQSLLALAVLWQMCSPGVPHIYYGDEAGLAGEKDPENRKPYPWGQENETTLNLYRQLGALHQLYPVLYKGDFRAHAIDEHMICFERFLTEVDGSVSNRALLFINSDPDTYRTTEFLLPEWIETKLFEIYPGGERYTIENRSLSISMPPKSGKLLMLDPWARKDVDKREAGILMPLTALPSDYGVGDLGKSAHDFLQFLADAGQSVWQILPYTQVDEFNSPYRSSSSFAGNLLLIDLEDLVDRSLMERQMLTLAKDTKFEEQKVDYEKAWALKHKLLRLVYLNYSENPSRYPVEEEGFRTFKEEEQYWLEDYALFMVMKKNHPGEKWNQWENELARRDEGTVRYYRNLHKKEIEEESFYQYLFFSQWDTMKRRALELGISIIGDLPLYVAYESSDVWCNQELFQLNDEGDECLVAGVPPDYFSETGQRWGNPIYNWDIHVKTDFAWWVNRVKALNKKVDRIRIDHFRALADYYEILASDETAINGEWRIGPGMSFFEALEHQVKGLNILVENLGDLSYAANELKERSGYPGMLVLQHLSDCYDENHPLPQLYQRQEVLYSGTHDDDTLKGFLEKCATLPQGMDLDDYTLQTVRRLYQSDAELVIIPLQDHLLLGSEARTNRPGVAEGNWTWRASASQLTDKLARRIKEWTLESKRGC